MSKLKTLKDLQVLSVNDMFNFGASKQEEAIKKEAIKWYKFYDKDYQDQLSYRKNHLKSSVKGIYEQCLEDKLDWIKHFFDLSKEDYSD